MSGGGGDTTCPPSDPGQLSKGCHFRRGDAPTQEILNTSPEDFKRFGVLLEQVAQKGRVVVVGSNERLQQDLVEMLRQR